MSQANRKLNACADAFGNASPSDARVFERDSSAYGFVMVGGGISHSVNHS